MMDKIFETSSSCPVKYRTREKVQFLFFRSFFTIINKFFIKLARQLVYTMLSIITLSFTCGERQIWTKFKKSQNIMTMILVASSVFCWTNF